MPRLCRPLLKMIAHATHRELAPSNLHGEMSCCERLGGLLRHYHRQAA
ncbi:MAG: hypothetical protein WD534_05480 [Phycisphaeraceae bacterium]